MNIEGISKEKGDYISNLAEEHGAEVVLLQETHTETEDNLRARGSFKGYVLIDFLLGKAYGLACYVKKSSVCNVAVLSEHFFHFR